MEWIGIGFGVLGLLFGANCYYHLWRWARDCKYGRIVISYNRKVVLQAPLVEWLLWCRKARKDGFSKGRTVFSRSKVAVSVIQPEYPPNKVKLWFIKHKRKKAPTPTPTMKWDAKEDTVA